MNTTYFINQVMGNLFQTKTNPALPDAYYIGLSSTAPNADGGNVTEPSANASYARVKLETLGEPTDGVITNTAAIFFQESTEDWGTMTHVVIFDGPTGGNLLMYQEMAPRRVVDVDTIVTILSGGLRLTLSSDVS